MKNCVPKTRSKSSSSRADAEHRHEQHVEDRVSHRPQTVSGMRMYVMPGARKRITVVT